MIMSNRNCSGILSTLAMAAALGTPPLAQPAVADVIKSISVTTPDQFLTYPTASLPTLPDEHTTFFPLAINETIYYLVFAASNIYYPTGITGPSGTVALETPDLTNFTYASGYTNPVMVPPVNFNICNIIYDTEFDENYAAPGSVLQDPTRPAGHFIMIYEAENHCPGDSWQANFYATVGLTRSADYGRTWPAPVNSEFGDNSRRPVLKMNITEPVTIPPSPIIAMGDALPSAFIDTTPKGEHYIYVSYFFFGSAADGYLRMARAKLGDGKLDFKKWYMRSFSQSGIDIASGIGGLDSGVTPSYGCEGTASGQTAQYQHGGSISYLTTTNQYLLTFACVSLGGSAPYYPIQAGWYYSTATSLEKQDWTTPQLIKNSQFSATTCFAGGINFDGWYPSFMTPSSFAAVYQPGHLGNTGQVFFLNGCNTGSPRSFVSRTFTITVAP